MEELLDIEISSKLKLDGISSFWDRVRDLVADYLLILIIHLLIYFKFFYIPGENNFIFISLYWTVHFSYYILFESILGLTPGKFLNKCRVVNNEFKKASFGQVLIRTVIRNIPFQFITIFTPYQKPLHDLLSKTWVVRVKK
ncbi:Uncharacterized membrane protein YckC, RDD family [Lishizhenia tianjinensis]|uniref:Uncharacterized membrane protein YckC, RDD family n=1 Tax=Lishizhenia tianjinensis TaxID=477690 RepID=A0A1I7A4I2_9FLAO|nr:RDD family protein [Lishizhenia tianjinensis]SFT69820.1 Uncharacterized membrane protein YckC, RDD family [Lishizhenia tianjinensis]